jgi:hypothetical protein
MPATYADVLFAKIAVERGVFSAEQIRECLNAQEAGRRAGVEQSLGQVLIKRGYANYAQVHDLERARELGERSRRAKLAVELLIRRGRPAEEVVRAAYETMRRNGFPAELGAYLEGAGEITAAEHASLRSALERAWTALYMREADELARMIEAAAGHAGLGGRGAAVPAPPAPMPYAAPPAAWGYRRPGEVPPATPASWVPGALPYPIPQPEAAPAPGAWGQPAQGWQQRTAERPAVPAGWAPPPPVSPAAYYGTAERAAEMNMLPAWAFTNERRALDGGASGAPGAAAAPLDESHAHDARLFPVMANEAGRAVRPAIAAALAEPTGPVPGYEIIERLGKGAIGIVYRATELATGRQVALKVLYPVFMQNATLVEQFRQESRVAASIEHPNVRRIYGGGEAGGYLYLAMEFVEGETLQDKIDRQAQLPEADCLRWGAQIASCMDHYARRGLLHRDLKPANIFISKDNRALLCDLGLSRRVYEDFVLSVQGAPLGAPWYVSPEQGLGTEQLDIRSDIYSLGITLFHCLTGRLPFFGGNAGVIISKHAREPLPDVRSLNHAVSRGTAQLIERMCAKRPEDRHQNARELLAEIAWLRGGIAGGGGTPIVPLDPPDAAEIEEVRPRRGIWRRILALFGRR